MENVEQKEWKSKRREEKRREEKEKRKKKKEERCRSRVPWGGKKRKMGNEGEKGRR